MKRVFFFRHGKSDWNSGVASDHERPINKRGQRAARTMGRFLAMAHQVPDHVICSSAVRTRETISLALQAGDWDCEIIIRDELYLAESGAVLDLIQRQDNEYESLMVVGHEPTSSEMVRRLCSQGLPSGSPAIAFPTATIAAIDLTVNAWGDCDWGRGQLRWIVPPKLLTKGGFAFAHEDD